MMLSTRRFLRPAIILPLLAGALLVALPEARAQVTPTTITYQGRLALSGTEYTGTATITMTLYDAVTAGNQVGGPVTINNVNVADGVFTVTPDFGAAAFTGNVDYVEIAVTTPGGGGPTTLSPRQPLTAAPFALALPFFRTIDNGPYGPPNILGGASNNAITGGAAGVTISGGQFNTASGDSATLGGGYQNTASGGYATVGGGGDNTASGQFATVGGGEYNTASVDYATVAGGYLNTASGDSATVGGGLGNTAAGNFSFAAGYHAQAMHTGTFVWADDSASVAKFTSTDANQFLIRAAGGVGIGTNMPSNQLTVAGNADVTGKVGIGTNAPSNPLTVAGNADVTGKVGIGTNAPSNPLTVAGNANFTGSVGIGTASPAFPLHVVSSGTSIPAQFESNSTFCTWLNLFNSSTGGTYWHLISSGSANGEGAGKLLIGTGVVNNSNATLMTLQANGRVGIGTSAPDQTLSVVGNASKTGGGSWAAYSDARLKHDMRPMTGTLDKLLALRGFTFAYNPDAVSQGRGLPGTQIGLVAQDVERVFPDWVSTSPDGFKMVTERATTALMVEALRDLRHEKDAQLDAQRAEIETVKHDHADKQREIDQLKAENDRSQQRLAALEAQVARLLHAADSPSSDPR